MSDAETERYTSPTSEWLLDRVASPPPAGPAMVIPPPVAGPPAPPPGARPPAPRAPNLPAWKPAPAPLAPFRSLTSSQNYTNYAGAMAIASMVVGAVALIFSPLSIFDLPIAVLGIILSILGLTTPRRRGLAIAGLVLSLLGLLIAGALTMLAVGLAFLL